MSDLTDKWRAKYPGDYDDLSDDELESSILKKYPEYKDLAKSTVSSPSKADTTKSNTEKASTDDWSKEYQEAQQEEARTKTFNAETKREAPKESFISSLWHKATAPLISLTPEMKAALSSYSAEHPVLGGIGELATESMLGLSSPLNLATAGMGGAELAATKAGIPKVASALALGTRALSVPTGVEGAQNLFGRDSTIPQRISGGIELGGSILGMTHGLGAEEPNFRSSNEPIDPNFFKYLTDPNYKELPPVMPAEMVPVGGEAAFNSNRPKLTINDAKLAAEQMARDKFGMGEDLPLSNQLAMEQMLNLDKPGWQQRLASETGSMSIGNKPRYRLDNESGTYIPIDEAGNQTGTAIGPQGQRLRGDLADESKYTPKSGVIDSSGKLQKSYDLARGMMSVDLPFTTSAAFRQAAPLIMTKPWFEAWGDAAKTYGSKEAFNANMSAIESRPLFKAEGNIPSFAEGVGLKLTELGKYSRREEAIRGELAEKIPLYGAFVRGSNRAYTAYLNNLRADTFENLIADATAQGLNPRNNLPLARQIAEFVNTATGVGKLAVEVGPNEINLEKHARLLSNTLFSPRKVASEMRMLNPSTYVFAEPFVRKQYAMALARRVGTWWTIAGLAELAGAQVGKDPNSADFGKIKIGNTRIDPPGGLQQYLVLGHRMAPLTGSSGVAEDNGMGPVDAAKNFFTMGGGGISSSTQKKFSPFGKGYKPETRPSTLGTFAAQRMHPTARYIMDALAATRKEPFHTLDRTSQMFLPMLADDLAQAGMQNPWLLPAVAGLSSTGMGVQSYERGSMGKPTFIPEEYDYLIGR